MYEQKIYFGAPGTGKSFIIDKHLRDENVPEHKVFRVVIHPEYSYSDFVGQLLPINTLSENGENKINFKFQTGPFTRALAEAYSDYSQNVYLVIEELSRGNAAAIFGDIFQLLDRNEHFESRYTINNKNIAGEIISLTGDDIKLPSNFNILCTVNMNDQNVYPMDTAFKRRFEWEYVSSKPVKKFGSNTADEKLNNPRIYIDNGTEKIKTNWISFYTTLNAFITDKINGLGKNEDRQVGQFFLEFNNEVAQLSYSNDEEKRNSAKTKIDMLVKNKLLLYLWQDVQSCGLAGNRNNLFNKNINSYDDLYEKYGKEQVFSDIFIRSLMENVNKYDDAS